MAVGSSAKSPKGCPSSTKSGVSGFPFVQEGGIFNKTAIRWKGQTANTNTTDRGRINVEELLTEGMEVAFPRGL